MALNLTKIPEQLTIHTVNGALCPYYGTDISKYQPPKDNNNPIFLSSNQLYWSL
jgi:hypothetical protein